MRGRKYVTPASGMSPILTKATENLALGREPHVTGESDPHPGAIDGTV